MQKKYAALVSILLTFFAGNATANIANHNFTSASLVSYSGDKNPFGLAIGASHQIKPEIVLDATFQTATQGSFKYNMIQLGGNYLYTHDSKFDLLAGLFLSSYTIGTGSSKTGLGLLGRGIMKIREDIQGEALVRLFDGTITFGGAGAYQLNKQFSVGGLVDFNADFFLISAFGRYYY